MPIYKCQKCDYTTPQKANYFRHLKTHNRDNLDTINRTENKKFIKNGSNLPILTLNSAENSENFAKSAHKSIPICPFSPQKWAMIQNENNCKNKVCLYCEKEFSSVSHNKRHMLKSCKVKQHYMSMEKQKYETQLQRQEILKEKEEEKRLMEARHEKQIQMLLEKVGNTTINNNCQTTHNTQHNTHIQQNNLVQLNNFGSENLNMLTENYMRKMIIYPYTAIPKMIKKIHFNEKYPENQNIRMLNKKDNKLQIRNNDKWEFVDKKETMEQLIQEKNYQLDTYYENNRDKFEGKEQDRFDSFQDRITVGDRDVIKSVNTGSELIFWNSM